MVALRFIAACLAARHSGEQTEPPGPRLAVGMNVVPHWTHARGSRSWGWYERRSRRCRSHHFRPWPGISMPQTAQW
jgi:hypothetical protein